MIRENRFIWQHESFEDSSFGESVSSEPSPVEDRLAQLEKKTEKAAQDKEKEAELKRVENFKSAMSAIARSGHAKSTLQKYLVPGAPEGIGNPLFIVGYNHPTQGKIINGENQVKSLHHALQIFLIMGDHGIKRFHIEGVISEKKIQPMPRIVDGKESSASDFRSALADYETFRSYILDLEEAKILDMNTLARIILACSPEMECSGAEKKEIVEKMQDFESKEYNPAIMRGKEFYDSISEKKKVETTKDLVISYTYNARNVLQGLKIGGQYYSVETLKKILGPIIVAFPKAVSFSPGRESYVGALPGEAVLFGDGHLDNFAKTKSDRTLGLILPKDTPIASGEYGFLYDIAEHLLREIETHRIKK